MVYTMWMYFISVLTTLHSNKFQLQESLLMLITVLIGPRVTIGCFGMLDFSFCALKNGHSINNLSFKSEFH